MPAVSRLNNIVPRVESGRLGTNKDVLTESELLEEDLIESRFGVHDSNHFEVKLDYTIRSEASSRYEVDYYFFIPSSLGINKHTYKDDRFYSDVQAYIRFKTPNISLPRLTSNVDKSALQLIRQLIRRVRANPRDGTARQELSYELRMFGCVMRAQVRDRVRVLRSKLGELDGAESTNRVLLEDASQIGTSLLSEVTATIEAWRSLRTDFVDESLPRSLNETYAFVDEYLSIFLEVKLASIVRRIDSIGELGEDAERLQQGRMNARDLLLAERRYRADAGYSTVDKEDKDDHFVYRQGVLKKFVMSVLWLDISKEKEGKKVANVGAAIAAGTAMLFAVLATIFSTTRFGVNSGPFIIAAIITYILKDRIKDWLKGYFGSRFSRWLADYSLKVRDPLSGESIGRCRESVTFRGLDDVPRDVLECRRVGARTTIEAMAKPEVVLHYSKRVSLHENVLTERMHLKDYDVNDIVRFSLWQFMVRADDPTSSVPYFSELKDRVERRKFRKVYHINLIMALRSPESTRPAYKRMRVIFDKNKILEIQDVL